MEDRERALNPGHVRARIANEFVRLHSKYYGKGPTRARTYLIDDLVVVVLEETFTTAERTLIGQGETTSIKHIRRRFQQVMADQFKAIVEQATGRRVRSFMSETDVEQDLSVEVFLLGGERTDMVEYEPPGAGQDPR